MDVLWALLLIGVAIFVGGILLRRVPAVWLGIGVVLVVFGLGIPALVIDDNRAETASGSGASEEAAGGGGEGGGETTPSGGGEQGGGGGNAAAEQGKLIFTQSCGTCHVLQDAGTTGQIGPPLDDLKPNAQRVEAAIKNGGTGSGTMPANIVSGKEAEQVAEYVASVAGQ